MSPEYLITRWFVVLFFFTLIAELFWERQSIYRKLEKSHQTKISGRIAVMNWLDNMLPKRSAKFASF